MRKYRNHSNNQAIKPSEIATILNHRMVCLEELPPEYRSLLLSHYGTPRTGIPVGDRIPLETDMNSTLSAAEKILQKNLHTKECRSLETDRRSATEILLSTIATLVTNGNTPDPQRALEEVYSGYCAIRRVLGCQRLSRSRFYVMLRQKLECCEQTRAWRSLP